MLTWTRYLLIVSLAAVLLAGPVVSAPSLPRSCRLSTTGETGKACKPAELPCCAACSGGEKSCCHHGPVAPQVSDDDAGCGACPLGQCECCQSTHGPTLICVLPQHASGAPRDLCAPLLTADAKFFSRSDEPLLPPPIA